MARKSSDAAVELLGQIAAPTIDRRPQRPLGFAEGCAGQCQIPILADRLVDAADPLAAPADAAIAHRLEEHELRLETAAGLADPMETLLAAAGGLATKPSPHSPPPRRDPASQPGPPDRCDREFVDAVLEIPHARLHEVRRMIGPLEVVGGRDGRNRSRTRHRVVRPHLAEQACDRLETHVPVPLRGESSTRIPEVRVDAIEGAAVASASKQMQDRPSPLDRLAAPPHATGANGRLVRKRDLRRRVLCQFDLREDGASDSLGGRQGRVDPRRGRRSRAVRGQVRHGIGHGRSSGRVAPRQTPFFRSTPPTPRGECPRIGAVIPPADRRCPLRPPRRSRRRSGSRR